MDERYNSGTAAIASMGRSVIKSYRDVEDDELINANIIREASILKYLNDRSVRCVPKLYDVNTTTMTMSYNGRSIQSILDNLTINERCNFFIQYIDRIINAVEQLHINGVSHNDLSMKNILIDDNDNVIIIDFNMSNFIGVNRIDVLGDYYHCPEYYTANSDGTNIDWWILGVFILYGCLDYEYVPLRIAYWSEIIKLTVVRYNSLEEFDNLNHEGKLTGGIIYPSEIPIELVAYLDKMLQLNPLDRMTNLTREVTVNQSEVQYYYSIARIDGALIKGIINPFDQLSLEESYRIGVAIDIIRRLSRLKTFDTGSINTLLAIVGLTVVDTNYINEMIAVSDGNNSIVRRIQEEILNVLNWRIYTNTNVRITSDRSDIILKKLSNLLDENTTKLFIMSDLQLIEYF